ncbi:hypothetical protein [Rhodococcus globerulus]|uniref:hypothetical protein n=1 Tax=Rhodococcus globerulus TaxID=33008 RepID=UPI00301B4207
MSRETLCTCHAAPMVLEALEVAIRGAVAAVAESGGSQAQSSVGNDAVPDNFNGQQNGRKAPKFPQVNRTQERV